MGSATVWLCGSSGRRVVLSIDSASAGFIGIFTATKANLRTALAARHQGVSAALAVAFASGSVMGIAVASLGLLYLMAGADPISLRMLSGFGMGASSVALFARVGGGIYTKTADVGADLVGKIEEGIPEDDPRNPGAIADNVGDVAGMGADIFESYCGAIIASIVIAATMGVTTADLLGGRPALLLLPLMISSGGLLASLLGIAAVRMYKPALS